MMKQKELMPKRRFEEFQNNDFWKQYNLKDITQKIGSGKTPRGGSSVYIKSGIPLLRSQNINNDQVDFEEVVYISDSMDEEMSNSRVSQNDVLLNITGASIGRSAVYKHAKSANVNQHVCIIRPNKEFNSRFIQLNLTSVEGQKQIGINQAGGAREGLNFQQIGKMNFYYPGYKEQQEIGQFFKHLDEMITLEQRKIDKTKALKSAYLVEMFPAEGERLPKRRFAGFSEGWREKELNKLGNFKSNGVNKKNNKNEKTVSLLNYMDIYSRKKINIFNSNELMQVTAKSNEILENNIEKNDVFFTPTSETVDDIGRVMVIAEDLPGTVYSYHLMRYRPNKNEIYSIFPNYAFATGYVRNQMKISAQGVQRFVLNRDAFEDIKVLLPCYQEQQKIGLFFKNIDDTILNHQQKLDKLKATKQAYLHEMFV